MKKTGTEKMKAWYSFSSGEAAEQYAEGFEELQDIANPTRRLEKKTKSTKPWLAICKTNRGQILGRGRPAKTRRIRGRQRVREVDSWKREEDRVVLHGWI